MNRLLLVATVLAGCYSPPEPECGFVCGPHNACPADYFCADDRHCHKYGTLSSLVCGTPDAALDSPAGPRVLTTFPADGTTGVAVNTRPAAVIDQNIVQFDPLDVTVADGSGNLVAGHGASPTSSMAVEFLPALQVAANTTFTVKISAAVLATYGPVGPYSWSFTTGDDNIAPSVAFVDPPVNATAVGPGTAVSVDFDEVVLGVDMTSFSVTDGVTPVAGTLTSTGGHSYVLTPAAALAGATTYTVTYTSVIHDAAGNTLTAYSYSFTTQ
jgi:hypothetical protein